MSPEILHLLFTSLGLFLGWYIKHQSIQVPANVLGLVQTLINARAHQEAHGFLRDLLAGASAVAAPESSPRS